MLERKCTASKQPFVWSKWKNIARSPSQPYSVYCWAVFASGGPRRPSIWSSPGIDCLGERVGCPNIHLSVILRANGVVIGMVPNSLDTHQPVEILQAANARTPSINVRAARASAAKDVRPEKSSGLLRLLIIYEFVNDRLATGCQTTLRQPPLAVAPPLFLRSDANHVFVIFLCGISLISMQCAGAGAWTNAACKCDRCARQDASQRAFREPRSPTMSRSVAHKLVRETQAGFVEHLSGGGQWRC